MTILAAIMTALAAAEFVCLVALTWRRSETARTAELQAALSYVVDHVDHFDRVIFIRAYLAGNSQLLAQQFPTWASYRNDRVAIATDITA